MARRHWMDQVADSVREQVRAAVPVVAEAIRGDVPFGYEPPKRSDEVEEFLNSPAEARRAKAVSMSPHAYEQYTARMMTALAERFGPAAQTLFPLLQGAPMEAVAQGEFPGANPRALLEGISEAGDLTGVDIWGLLSGT